MLRSLSLLSLATILTAANAQSAAPAPLVGSDQTQPPAPIVRSHQQLRVRNQQDQITETQPIPGVWLRSESTSVLKTISATPQRTEVRLEHGRLNVDVHQPSQRMEILIDLPAGQTSLLKDGLYTFNADTNTVRVLRGEAAAWPGLINSATDMKPIKIKEDHQLSLASTGNNEKTVESYPYELNADLLPFGNASDGRYGNGYELDYPRYEYPSPYYAGLWGYPGPYPGFYPGFYGYGYPVGIGVGFSYYGGFHGGYGYRGGFRR